MKDHNEKDDIELALLNIRESTGWEWQFDDADSHLFIDTPVPLKSVGDESANEKQIIKMLKHRGIHFKPQVSISSSEEVLKYKIYFDDPAVIKQMAKGYFTPPRITEEMAMIVAKYIQDRLGGESHVWHGRTSTVRHEITLYGSMEEVKQKYLKKANVKFNVEPREIRVRESIRGMANIGYQMPSVIDEMHVEATYDIFNIAEISKIIKAKQSMYSPHFSKFKTEVILETDSGFEKELPIEKQTKKELYEALDHLSKEKYSVSQFINQCIEAKRVILNTPISASFTTEEKMERIEKFSNTIEEYLMKSQALKKEYSRRMKDIIAENKLLGDEASPSTKSPGHK